MVRRYINEVAELHAVYDKDAEEEEDKEEALAQLLSDFKGHLATFVSSALHCVT
jgi:hypothetical protein